MSFICWDCEKPSNNGDKPVKLLLKKREKTYNNGGKGWEIEKEVLICDNCSYEMILFDNEDKEIK